MQTPHISQVLVLVLTVLGLFANLYQDHNGRKAKPPGTFTDVVISVLVSAFMFWVCYEAGAFSTLF